MCSPETQYALDLLYELTISSQSVAGTAWRNIIIQRMHCTKDQADLCIKQIKTAGAVAFITGGLVTPLKILVEG